MVVVVGEKEWPVLKSDGARGGCVVELRCARSLKTFRWNLKAF